jgi:hypothetical protein
VVVERTVLPLCACVTGGSCYTAGNIGSKVRCGIAERLPKIPGDRVPRTSIADCRSKIVPTLHRQAEGLISGLGPHCLPARQRLQAGPRRRRLLLLRWPMRPSTLGATIELDGCSQRLCSRRRKRYSRICTHATHATHVLHTVSLIRAVPPR